MDARVRFGDLEVDTVIGANHRGALLTIIDRLSGYLWIRKLEGKNAAELVGKALKVLLHWKPWLHTITADNGKEFAENEAIAKDLGILFYLAKPYHSWERGANENANGLIRQFFPKKTCLDTISHEQVLWVERLLNKRPRKRLGFLTPKEKLEELLFNKKVAFTA